MKELVENITSSYRKLYGFERPIPLHEPKFTEKDIQKVSHCVESGWVSTVGPQVTELEKSIASYCKVKYAVATCTGTAALHLSFLSQNVGPNTEVICPDISFVATAASIAYTGASIVFLDVEEDTLALDPQQVFSFFRENTYENSEGYRINKQTHQAVSAVVVTHIMGLPARINELRSICKEFNVSLIEDAAESLGSHIDEKSCGTFGDLGILSFNGNKIITTGGGGMLLTNSEENWIKANHLATTAKLQHPYAYLYDEIGYNYRMPNLNAALGVSQLERIGETLSLKKKQFETLFQSINHSNITILRSAVGTSNHWLIPAKLKNVDAFECVEALRKQGILARPIWTQISKMRPYQGYQTFSTGVSDSLQRSIICLPNGLT